MDDLILLVMLAVFIMAVIFWLRSRRQTEAAAAQKSAQAAQNNSQMAMDIKATKTSRIVDAVSILDDLGATQSNYRHYCELVGTSMGGGGVKAPYSQRDVAFYTVRCYRIENVNGREYETLVASESSVDPFYFTDSSGDQKVYVDLDSFGGNVILVNSTNHIEGPNSDFSKAFKTQGAGGGSSKIGAAARACAGLAAERCANLLAGMPAALAGLRTRVFGRRGRALAFAGMPGRLDAAPLLSAPASVSNVMFAGPGGRGGQGGRGVRGAMGGPGGARPQGGPGQGRAAQGGRSAAPSGRSGAGSPYDPFGSALGGLGGLGDFLGSGWNSGMPGAFGGSYGRSSSNSGSDLGGVILGMGLSALLNSLATSSTASQTTTGGYQQQDSFRGYRIVEDIVPLNSPIYCIGEIYRHGGQVYMGRSLAEDYPTSYFATKPESEVLAALGK